MPNSQGQYTDDDLTPQGQFTDKDIDSPYTETGAAANPPIAPKPKIPLGLAPRQGMMEKYINPTIAGAENALPVAGMTAGGLLGSVGPGGGNIIGAALGGAAGVQTKRLLQGKPSMESGGARETGEAAATGAGGEMGAGIIGKGLEYAGEGLDWAKGLLSTPKKAGQLLERGIAPSGASAEDQVAMRENIQRAQKYIAPQTADYPVKGGEGGAMRSAEVYHQAGDNLWQKYVQPNVEEFKNVQRAGDDVANAIRSSFTDLDKQTKGAAVNAGDKLAQFYEGRPITVGEMNEQITQLNNDKAVSRYYNMSPNEQVQAELGDPSLRSKVTTLSKLREMMFDAIGDSGGDRLGNQFREARKDWGAIRSIEDQIRNTKVPTPQPLWQRMANSVRGLITPRGADFWMRPQETLANLNNPNRLISKSTTMLGRTGLVPPEPEAPVSPIAGLLPERAGPAGLGPSEHGPEGGPGPWNEGRPGLIITPAPHPYSEAGLPREQIPAPPNQGGLTYRQPGDKPITIEGKPTTSIKEIQTMADKALATLRDPEASTADKVKARATLRFMPSAQEKPPATKSPNRWGGRFGKQNIGRPVIR